MKLSSIDVAIIALSFSPSWSWLLPVGRDRNFVRFPSHQPCALALGHGIACMSANLGPLEIMGHIANGTNMACVPTTGTGRELSRRSCLWVSSWCGILPNGLRSVPEYLLLRCNHRAHLLNSISFAVVTVLMSGINMFAFAVVFNSMLC
jgi:hypothetical protein